MDRIYVSIWGDGCSIHHTTEQTGRLHSCAGQWLGRNLMTRSMYESSCFFSKEEVQIRDSALAGVAALILQGL